MLTGVIPCGLLFGAAALAFRGLAVPAGIHAGLNLAAWAVGEKGAPGLWRITVEEGAAAGRARELVPVTGGAIVLLCALLLLAWSKRRGPVKQFPPADARASEQR